MTYWLEGTGRTQWSEIQPQLEGMTCAWADLDGFHVEAVPRERPGHDPPVGLGARQVGSRPCRSRILCRRLSDAERTTGESGEAVAVRRRRAQAWPSNAAASVARSSTGGSHPGSRCSRSRACARSRSSQHGRSDAVTLGATLETSDISSVRAHHIHGLVASWLEGDAPLSAHKAPVKPFAVSPLREVGPDRWAIEVGLLADELDQPLLAGALRGCRRSVRLGAQRATVVRSADGGPLRPVAGTGRGSSWCCCAEPRGQFPLRFHTPTTFRSGRRSNPLPLAGSVFGHYRRQWQAFAPAELALATDLASCGLVVAHLDGCTSRFDHRWARTSGSSVR